ncbi:cyclase family protein [Limnobaculum zhutongyuii]|uniref:Cyclase family protein n=1 Tax=Limnobaculum zhutongyuii TaxID=2498113 RepID=A0A411WGS9_9GAMM|nr:cyclase family protein [Limnobaculum zhutongyuii]QBH95187.1 cyclase family protein [Limnobaculum zhutongyuii]TQS86416.1 cyclase family protein [Limnobaculum zhutongyuii]
MKIIDLSVTIEDSTPCDPPSMPTKIDYWGHEKGAEHMRQFFPTATDKDLPEGLGWSIEYVQLTTHSGTHLDAPWHYHPTMNKGEPARTIDHIPLEWCFSDGVKLDFSEVPGEGGKITVAHLEAELERIGYSLKPLDIVVIHTGAMKHWGTTAYTSAGCGMSREATLYLLERGIKVVGTDAWSWDRPLSLIAEEFEKTGDSSLIWEGHFAGIEREYYHMEKMNNLDQLPPFGFKIACFPVKIKAASAGWCRPVAMFDL